METKLLERECERVLVTGCAGHPGFARNIEELVARIPLGRPGKSQRLISWLPPKP